MELYLFVRVGICQIADGIKGLSPIFSTFFFQSFGDFAITVTASSYFSHNPWKILRFEDNNENVSGYGTVTQY